MKKVAEFRIADFFARHVKFIAVIGVPLFTAACSNAPPQQTSAAPRSQYQGETTGSIQRPVISRPATVYTQPYPQRVVYAPPPPQRVIYAPASQTELRGRQLAAACETTASVPRTTRTAAYSPRYADATGSIPAPSQYQAPPARPNAMWHVVAPGETLSTIARHYRVSVIEIARINELRNFPQIRSGGMLLIPLT
jgi:LysM repeat protein